MTQPKACPGMEVWRRFHAGDVCDEELETLAAHQESCESCRDRLASFDLKPSGQADTTVDASAHGHGQADRDRIGMAVQGFEVETMLGEGGMGLVWVAREAQAGRQVALKQLRPECEGDAGLRQRFLAEARVTAQLEHPGIVPVYRVIERPDGSPAYAMRLIRGQTLLEAARGYHGRPGGADSLARRELLQAFVSVCQTLAYAHSRGVLHRDLKGDNIILGRFGEVLVLDWGLAKVSEGPSAGSAVSPLPGRSPEATGQGAVAGTPSYMSPEQARGEPADPRTDVFGLGAVLYLILTGRPPYAAADRLDVLLLAAEAKQTPPRRLVRGVPRALEAVCLKALAVVPANRYQSAADLAEEVKRWLAGEPVTACPEPVIVRARRWVKRHRVTASSLAAALLVALIAGGGYAWQEQGRQQTQLAQQREREREASGLLAGAVGLQEGARQLQRQLQPALAKVQLNHSLGFAERAAGLLREGDDPALRQRVETVRADLRQVALGQEMELRLEQKLKPDLADAHYNLGVALVAQGRHKEAEQACREAIKLKPDLAEAHSNLGAALSGQGRDKEAEQACRDAIKLQPDYAEAHYNLGVALRGQGMFKDALKSLRHCALLFPGGSGNRQLAQHAIAETERLIELDGKLTDFLVGKVQPASSPEKVRLAEVAQQPYRQLYATAVSLYAEAFAARPRLAAQHRYNAACAAARAGTGQGKDADKLDSNDCVHLRHAALDWLQTDLSVHATQLAGSDPKAADASHQALLPSGFPHWKQDADLAAVRDREPLAKLPEGEQADWRKLWAEVDALLARHKPAR